MPVAAATRNRRACGFGGPAEEQAQLIGCPRRRLPASRWAAPPVGRRDLRRWVRRQEASADGVVEGMAQHQVEVGDRLGAIGLPRRLPQISRRRYSEDSWSPRVDGAVIEPR